MKLRQIYNSTFVVFEITDISLKITSLKFFKREKREILFENILMKDRYELEYHDKSFLGYIFVSLTLFVFFAEHAFMNSQFLFFAQHSARNSISEWTGTIILGALSFYFIIRFLMKRTRIFIPVIDQRIIRLFTKQPGKKSVEEFIRILEGKVNLAAKKRPEKTDLKDFIIDHPPKRPGSVINYLILNFQIQLYPE